MTPATVGTDRIDQLLAEHESSPGATAALAPVADALLGAARRRAQAVSAAAERDAAGELARAHAEAERILGEARVDGARAGGQRAALQLTAARREARQVVLAARRAAYESLRQRAIEALEGEGSTARSRRLGDRLEVLASERVGAASRVRRTGPASLRVLATSDRRRATIGPAELVDWALQALAEHVESLWA